MPFPLSSLISLRPRLFHLTSRSNLAVLARTRTLRPAAAVLDAAGHSAESATRRRDARSVESPDGTITLRDQGPLYEGNIELLGGWTLADLVRDLNSRVFFWPGDDDGPIKYGLNHFERYSSEASESDVARADPPVVLRFDTAALVTANPSLEPELCAFNSGAPRTVNGRRSPRGPDTFLPSSRFERTPGSVVEVTFRGDVTLPLVVEWSTHYDAPWLSLETSGAGH